MNQKLNMKMFAFAGTVVKALFVYRPQQADRVELYYAGHALAKVNIDDIPDFIRLLQQVYTAAKDPDHAN